MYIQYIFLETVIQWNLVITRSFYLDHKFYLVISGFLLYQGKKTKKYRAGTNKITLLEGFVISDLFLMRFHCINKKGEIDLCK